MKLPAITKEMRTTFIGGPDSGRTRRECWSATTKDGIYRIEREEGTGSLWEIVHLPSGRTTMPIFGTLDAARRCIAAGRVLPTIDAADAARNAEEKRRANAPRPGQQYDLATVDLRTVVRVPGYLTWTDPNGLTRTSNYGHIIAATEDRHGHTIVDFAEFGLSWTHRGLSTQDGPITLEHQPQRVIGRTA